MFLVAHCSNISAAVLIVRGYDVRLIVIQVHLHLLAMAADSPPSPVHPAPIKWPNNRNDYEILEVIGKFRYLVYALPLGHINSRFL